jgi:hypothetical protein
MIRDQMLHKKLLTLELLVISISGAKALPLISPAALSLFLSDFRILLEQTMTVAPLFSANSFEIAKPMPLVEP